MKILKKGREQKGWSKKYSCTGKGNGGGGCGAQLLVSVEDLYQTSSSHYDGSTDHYYTFACAACGVETDVNYYDPPAGVPIPTKSAWLKAHDPKLKWL